MWSISQNWAGLSQPGNRHVRSRQRTKSAVARDGGVARLGWGVGAGVADFADASPLQDAGRAARWAGSRRRTRTPAATEHGAGSGRGRWLAGCRLGGCSLAGRWRCGGGVDGFLVGHDVDDGVLGGRIAGGPPGSRVAACAREGGAGDCWRRARRARRSSVLRGSASHTLRAISLDAAARSARRRGRSAGAHMLVVPATSEGDPNCTVSWQAPVRLRRSAPGSCSSTSASMAASVLATDSAPQRVTRPARRRPPRPSPSVGDQVGAPHDGAHQQIADHPGLEQRRHLGQPVAQRDPAVGLVQRHALADAERGGHLGGHRGVGVHPPQLALPGVRAPVRRAKISAITANLRAHAAFSARAHPPAASTNAASLNAARSAISGSEPSNIHSNLLSRRRPKPPAQPLPVDETTTVDNSACDAAPGAPRGSCDRLPCPRSRRSRRTCRARGPRRGPARRRR